MKNLIDKHDLSIFFQRVNQEIKSAKPEEGISAQVVVATEMQDRNMVEIIFYNNGGEVMFRTYSNKETCKKMSELFGECT